MLAKSFNDKLIDQLVAASFVSDANWEDAFRKTLRHPFVTPFLTRERDDWRLHYPAGPNDYRWLKRAYIDATLVVKQHDGAPVSSSIQPSVLARLFAAAHINSSDRVLELGTGTGYATALLCARLGDEQVASVELDNDLSSRARSLLGQQGYAPQIIQGDGDSFTSTSPDSEWSVLFATYAVYFVPRTWIANPRPGQRIVVPYTAGVCALESDDSGVFSGRFLPDVGNILSGQNQRAPAAVLHTGTHKNMEIPIADLYDPEFRFFASVTADIQLADAGLGEIVSATYDSEVQPTPNSSADLLRETHSHWLKLGRPSRQQVGLTVAPQTDVVWLEQPSTVIASHRVADASVGPTGKLA